MIRIGIYSEHDFRFPFYDALGNRWEGCRGCGSTRTEIEQKNLMCRRPMTPLAGELLGLVKDPSAAPETDESATKRIADALEKIEQHLAPVTGDRVSLQPGEGRVVYK